ncbi:hypothetical protein [Amycolatopsis rifamycinica]|uniref:hypothetical protein n=1 Tax=Amycolatopsis rifamycinica TaxID=287986 RepID=UPI000A6DA99F|nr:hypothetical protein [Amycolatopsis rifamycinica]
MTGTGPAGATLARLELTVPLEQLGKRFPALRIEGAVERRPNPAPRGMTALPAHPLTGG